MSNPLHPNLTIVEHPLVAHKLAHLRMADTSSSGFRRLVREISLLLGYEVLADLATEETTVTTPIGVSKARILSGKKLVFVPILRGGLGLLDGLLDLVPSARVGHIGLYRDPETLGAIEYFLKMPDDLADRRAVVCAPLLATGNTAEAAVSQLRQLGVRDIKIVCLVAAPEGVERLAAAHADVPIFAAALDSHLDDKGTIVPGLGDAGDRMFGTK